MLSRVQLFAAAWTVACQTLLSMRFLKQEYWRGLPFPPPGGLLDPGINLHFLQLLHWQEDSLPLSRPTKASLVAQTVKNLPATQEIRVQSLRQEDVLEKETATHSSILIGNLMARGACQATAHRIAKSQA